MAAASHGAKLDAAVLGGADTVAANDAASGARGVAAAAARAAMIALTALTLYGAGALEFLERRLIEMRFPLATSTPTDDLLIVTIDRESIDAIGVWPWPRRLHAIALDRLTAAGATTVLFDVDFSARTDEENDVALARALARAQPAAGLAVFTEIAADGAVDVGPPEAMLSVARPAVATMAPEADGRLWRAAPRQYWRDAPTPSLFDFLAPGDLDERPFWIDYGVDPGGLAVLPFVAVASGAFDPEAVRGRRVLIGATALELGDLAPTPRFGQLPGPVVQALAAQSVLLDRRLRRAHPAIAAALAFAAAGVAGVAARQRRAGRTALIFVATAGGLFALAVAAQRLSPTLLDIAPALTAASIGLFLDLTARAARLDLRLMASTLALSRVRALMAQVADSLTEGVVVIAPGAGVTAMNPAASAMFGGVDDAPGPAPGPGPGPGRRPEHALAWPRLRSPEALEAALDVAVRAGRRRVICLRPNGRRFFAEIAVTRLEGQDATQWVVVVRDVTSVVAAERVARRRERKLIDLTIRAEAATRAKTEFVATMSHELRTPLNAIIGCNSMMCEEAFGPLGAETYKTMATEARNSGARLLRVLTHVLDYANADLDKLDIEPRPVNLNALLAEAVARQDARAERAGVVMETELPGLPTVAMVDPIAIDKAFGNILGNAIRFSSAGGVVRVALRTLEGRRVEIVVSDQGVGMEPDFLKRCCEPFEQAVRSATRGYEGAGLGLTVAKAFVERHGGTLDIASAPGEGAVVTIRLSQ
ncbi:CHASE2 domain-containing protein [Rubrimonas cliftonensis]|uniref:histidine kinase n=1 Tax=Rubrimonas cliftonensis TaxID=89524 RepID=A0A1H4F6C7_9RHOB|nr:CHASE2 domain-containing protein [Rubrimonas cliftonensis]SEA92457.1 Signal transduction histidine kinase [Rubrimonas cliftonensis]